VLDARHGDTPGDDVADEESEQDSRHKEPPLLARHARTTLRREGTVAHGFRRIKEGRTALLQSAGGVPIVRA